jgi:arabinogalactan oligomer/maltooligosaccharide transport system permease protein
MKQQKVNWFKAFLQSRNIFAYLSVAVMGLGCISYGQVIKGLIFLGIEVLFVLILKNFGWQYLSHFHTLGENTQLKVWNEELQIYERKTGDNSMLILLFSVLMIAMIVLFICVWVINIKQTGLLALQKKNGEHIKKFKEDLRDLLDEKFHITLLSLPLTTLLLFTVLPIIFMILIAFTNFDQDHQPPGTLFTWVGLTNVTSIFLGNSIKAHTFVSILGWTFVWAIFATFTNYILGMLLAMLINNKLVKLKKMWRTLFIISIAIPQFVSLLLISKALDINGAFNVLLMQLGLINQPIPFLSNPLYARITVIIVNMWIGIPYTMMTFSGVLMNIPEELYEAAQIDGAGAMQRFIKITLPYMIFITAPATITTFVGNINNFNVIYLLTAGGPFSLEYYQGGKTDLLVTWLYKLTVDKHDYALASTIGIFIFMIVSTLSLIVYNRSGSVKKEDMFQ